MSSFNAQKAPLDDVWGTPAAAIAMPWTDKMNPIPGGGMDDFPKTIGQQSIAEGAKLLTPKAIKAEKDKNHQLLDNAMDALDAGLAMFDPNFAADPAAAIAHQKALRVMSSMLNITKPGAEPGKAQNEVSQEKFDEMVKLYMSIDAGKGDINFSGTEDNPALYKSYAMEDIARIMQTESGRKLIGALNNNTGGVKSDGKHVKTTIGEMIELDGVGGKNELTPQDDILNKAEIPKASDGTGTASKIYYEAGQPFKVVDGEPWGNARSDVVLYHEMVHALHVSHGDLAKAEDSKVEGSAGLTETIHAKEYQAVGLDAFADQKKNPFSENLYRKERLGVAADEQLNIDGSPELSDATMPQRLWYKYKPMVPLSTTASIGK